MAWLVVSHSWSTTTLQLSADPPGSLCSTAGGYQLIWADEFAVLNHDNWEVIEGWTELTDSMTRSARGSAADVWVAAG